MIGMLKSPCASTNFQASNGPGFGHRQIDMHSDLSPKTSFHAMILDNNVGISATPPGIDLFLAVLPCKDDWGATLIELGKDGSLHETCHCAVAGRASS